MSISSQTRGSTVEQLVWCEKRIAQLETELAEALELLAVPYRGTGMNHRIKMDEWLERRDALLAPGEAMQARREE